MIYVNSTCTPYLGTILTGVWFESLNMEEDYTELEGRLHAEALLVNTLIDNVLKIDLDDCWTGGIEAAQLWARFSD